MKTFTLKEVSKKINVTPANLRQWEKELNEFLVIPRTKQGARIYTESEINLLLDVKQMFTQKLTKDAIRQLLQKKMKTDGDEISETPDKALAIVSDAVTTMPNDETIGKNTSQFFNAMDTYKETFLNEVKEEIRSVLRQEVVDEVKKEITKGTFITVKSLSDSIYKSTANTKAEIAELSDHLEKASELTTESLQYLSTNITNASIETSEEIFTLSKQLSDSTEELSHYADRTNTEITSLTESLEKDREDFVIKLEQYQHEVRQREVAFQNMLTGFRDVATANEKKWWKFWE